MAMQPQPPDDPAQELSNGVEDAAVLKRNVRNLERGAKQVRHPLALGALNEATAILRDASREVGTA